MLHSFFSLVVKTVRINILDIVGKLNDDIKGGSGNDLLEGNGGSDVISGGSGNDIIYHWTEQQGTNPDGSGSAKGTDTITCGSGRDEVFMNTSVDGDTAASDCEIVHEG